MVATRWEQSDRTMQKLKHYIDLTQDSDGETLPASKRHKSSEPPDTQPARTPSSPASISPPRQPTPIYQSQQSINAKKAVTDRNGNTILTGSPFKNRPSWSKFKSKSPAPPKFSTSSPDESEHTNNSLPPPRSAAQKSSGKVSELSVPKQNGRQPSATKQINLTPTPATTSAAAAVPNDKPQHDSHQLGNNSPTPEGLLSHKSILRANTVTQRTPDSTPEALLSHKSILRANTVTQRTTDSTPLPDRPRNKSTTNPAQSPEIIPPTTNSASQVSVVIDNSERTFAESTTANDVLRKFIQPSSAAVARVPKRTTEVKKPAKSSEYRRRLLAELKTSTSAVYSRASSVEAVFGPHGFSPLYSTDGDKMLRKQLAQPKAKKIRRREVQLDWSSAGILAQQPFEPEKLVPPKKQAEEILRSKFDDPIQPPISFVNDVNDKQLGGKFQFISSYIRRPGVEPSPPQARNYGCDCLGGCRSESCDCLVDDREEDDFGNEINHGKIVPYRRSLDATGKSMSVLREDYMKKSYADGERSEIIECNHNCGCGADCWNRVVQKGRTLPLEIFMTAKCGFGIRCPQNITKGQFIDLYLGEVITETELESRELATDGAPSYIFSLDWFQQKDVYYVDSLNFGTPTRFLNHSCNPNCRVFTVILNRADKKVYGLAFFATRGIPAGTELNIDYNPQEAGKVYPKPQPGDDACVVLCHCGSHNCRVRLWPGPKMKKGKGWARS